MSDIIARLLEYLQRQAFGYEESAYLKVADWGAWNAMWQSVRQSSIVPEACKVGEYGVFEDAVMYAAITFVLNLVAMFAGLPADLLAYPVPCGTAGY